jgi:hypothetical protein
MTKQIKTSSEQETRSYSVAFIMSFVEYYKDIQQVELFWKNFFNKIDTQQKLHDHEPLLIALVRNFDNLLETQDDTSFKLIQSRYKIFLDAFALQILEINKQQKNQEIIQIAFNFTGNNFYFSLVILKNLDEELSFDLIRCLFKGFTTNMNERKHIGWSLSMNTLEEVAKNFLLKKSVSLDEVLTFVDTVRLLVKLLKKISEDGDLFFTAHVCPWTGWTPDPDLGVKRMMLRIFQRDWRPLVNGVTDLHKGFLTGGTLQTISKIQSILYRNEWNECLIQILREDSNHHYLWSYIHLMDGIFRTLSEKYWPREEFIKLVVQEDFWQKSPTLSIIKIYEMIESEVMFRKILERPTQELPAEWKKLKFLANMKK